MPSERLQKIISEISYYSKEVDDQSIKKVAKMCCDANRIFVAGTGRSGFAAKGFANRLMQLDFNAYFVGETTTPSITTGDLLVVGSGSGSTNSLIVDTNIAKDLGAKLVTLTIHPEANIGKQADSVIVVPGKTPKNDVDIKNPVVSVQPMGTLFEQLSWLVYDALILELMELTGKTEKIMFHRHANLE